MRKTTLVGIIFVGLILLSTFVMGTSSLQTVGKQDIQPLSSNWLEGWLYRKAHNITGSPTGVQINYPIPLSVRYDNGFDYENEVYLSGKCRTDFGDIRFTDSIGNSLDYWIQNRIEAVQALIWVDINYIPQNPENSTIHLYYGSPNATTTSNKDWVFPFATDFEDGTIQGWEKSWISGTTWDGVSEDAFQGNYSRSAGRNHASVSHFYESFLHDVYLTSGSYYMHSAACFHYMDYYQIPQEIQLLVNEEEIDNISNPNTIWRWLEGNFTLSESTLIGLEFKFHLQTVSGFGNGGNGYYIDSVIIRKWCDPEPTHGAWGAEEVPVDDDTPPQIHSVNWRTTAPYPFVESSIPRHTEPVIVTANVSDETEGSGVAFVHVSYHINSSQWWWTTMTYNTTEELWTATIPGQPGNSSLEFFIGTSDLAGNVQESSLFRYEVQHLIVGDLNGDGSVDIFDIVAAAGHYGESW